jgi:hypothetical protein
VEQSIGQCIAGRFQLDHIDISMKLEQMIERRIPSPRDNDPSLLLCHRAGIIKIIHWRVGDKDRHATWR